MSVFVILRKFRIIFSKKFHEISDDKHRKKRQRLLLTLYAFQSTNMPLYGADLQIHIHCPGRPGIWRSLRMKARPPGLPAVPDPSRDRSKRCSTLGDSLNGCAGPGAPVTTLHNRKSYSLGICGVWHPFNLQTHPTKSPPRSRVLCMYNKV